jgi:TetR/AcrR family transcriptional repressor of nem operon
LTLKQKIVHEALRLFSLKGFLNTSIDDILTATGASKGGLYNHFKSKDELFKAVMLEAREIWQAKVLAGLEAQESPLAKVRLLLSNYQNLYLKDTESIPGGCIFITLAVELDDQREDFAADLQKGFDGVKVMLRQLLEEAREAGELKPEVEPVGLSEMIFAAMVGASVLYGMQKEDATLHRSFDPLVEYLDKLAA